MYRNRAIDGLLKHISEKAAANAKWNYYREVAFNSRYMSGLPNMYLNPTFTQRKKKELYDFVLGILPEDYLEYGQKEVNEMIKRWKIEDSRFPLTKPAFS